MIDNQTTADNRHQWLLHFERLANQHASALPIHALLGERLEERLDGLKLDPTHVLDMGCGWGAESMALAERFPNAQVVALDWSRSMIGRAKKHLGWWRRPFELVQGDLCHPPIADQSMDVVFASGVLPYLDDPTGLFTAACSVLKPGGLFLVSTLGPDTLSRERQMLGLSSPPWQDVQGLGSGLSRCGFHEPVLDTDWVTMRYRRPDALCTDLEAMGLIKAGDVDASEMTKSLAWPENQAWETTWECVFATAFAPSSGQAIPSQDGTIASVSLDQIKIRKR